MKHVVYFDRNYIPIETTSFTYISSMIVNKKFKSLYLINFNNVYIT